ncbi:cytochrome P450 ClCP1 [Thozetella sp. PMI_491]|nr:cytochrome P450 ClCP1 [Thozetella sp. PMI_491]
MPIHVNIRAAAQLAIWLSLVMYNLFFHPLRKFPGPLLHRAFRLPSLVQALRGTLVHHILGLHEKYGPVVRVAPDELAFANPSAWKEIMGHRGPGKEEVGKWLPFYRPVKGMPTDIISAPREEHSRLRRQVAHGFSDKSMRDQEPIIKSFVDLLISQLRVYSKTGPVDMTAWYNFTTFDIIGDLAFGEAFGCLKSGEYHPWVKNIFFTAKMGVILQAAAHYGFFSTFLLKLVPKSMLKKQEFYQNFARNQVLKRMQSGEQRSDLMEGLLSKVTEWNMPMPNLVSNASLLVTGGSETTATLLAGVTYLLLANPEKLAKLQEEVRARFTSEDEITVNAAGQLPYMLACLDEAFRMYPPVAIGLPRVAPSGGITVNGHFVPEDTHVAVHHYAAYHYSANWLKPFEYHPERFLGDPEFAADEREVLQPFHIGTRNCVGRHLAYAEMRLILARVVYNFDMKMAEESRGWIKQKVFNFWDKPPLYAYLTPRA